MRYKEFAHNISTNEGKKSNPSMIQTKLIKKMGQHAPGFKQELEKGQPKKVDEVIPALAARAAGALAVKGAGKLAGAAAKGIGNLAGNAVSGIGAAAKQAAGAVGTQAKALFTQQGLQRQMGAQPGKTAGAQAGQQTPPVQIKPGVKILHPGLGQTKIKSIMGKNVTLDTQKELGQNITVDQNELLAVLGQGQQA